MAKARLVFILTFLWTLITILAQENTETNVAKSLMECYNNTEYLDSNLKRPMSMNYLIALIRKVENGPLRMDLKMLATNMLQRFRQDGILKAVNVNTDLAFLPYSPYGDEYKKFKIILQSLVPGNAFNFPNETMTPLERCTVHLMLSESVETRERGDENLVCNKKEKYRLRVARSASKLPPDVELVENNSNSNKKNIKSKIQVNPNEEVATIPRKHTSDPVKPESMCPLEYGVVYTKWGAVSAGNVIAGIAAGSEPQPVDVRQVFGTEQNAALDNVWGATLAGDLAEAAFLSKGNSREITIGVDGGWYSAQVPHGYYLSKLDDYYITDAEIRGDLDGLILGTRVKDEYRNSARNMKLSQLLDMYYSERGVFRENLKACRRQELLTKFAPTDTMVKEALAFARILHKTVTIRTSIYEEALEGFVKEAVNKFSVYVPSNFRDLSCLNNNEYQVARTDLIVVLDYEWQYEVAEATLAYLFDNIDINPYNSNYTIINAKTGNIVLNSSDTIATFYEYFNKSAYERESKGIDFQLSLQTVVDLALNKVDAERIKNDPSSKSLIAVFITNNPTISAYDKDVIITKLNEDIRPKLPDLRLLAVTGGPKETFDYIVKDSSKDIIQLQNFVNSDNIVNSISQLVNRIKQVPSRITSYKCTSSWRNEGDEKTLNQNIEPKGVNYYKVSPNYFYGGDNNRVVKIKGQGNGALTVCHSRTVELPRSSGNVTSGSADVSGVNCKTITSDEYSIELSDPCGSSYTISECAPLYFSVESKEARTGSLETCLERNCRFTDNLKYTISVENFGCYSNANVLFMNVFVVLSALCVLFIKT